jgi:hypothetical protein
MSFPDGKSNETAVFRGECLKKKPRRYDRGNAIGKFG